MNILNLITKKKYHSRISLVILAILIPVILITGCSTETEAEREVREQVESDVNQLEQAFRYMAMNYYEEINEIINILLSPSLSEKDSLYTTYSDMLKEYVPSGDLRQLYFNEYGTSQSNISKENVAELRDMLNSTKEIIDYESSGNGTNESSSTSTKEIKAPEDNTTMGERNALQSAIDYLEYTAFSRDGLVEQLEFEGYTRSEAEYGADNSGADWREQAARKALDYLEYSSFSRQELIDQLLFEKFTESQALYGVDSVGY